uniref:Uncharacterized protein n=1 Tax=Arundo donax TaxID=35708 RepID=A0A0A9D187_ARUDO
MSTNKVTPHILCFVLLILKPFNFRICQQSSSFLFMPLSSFALESSSSSLSPTYDFMAKLAITGEASHGSNTCEQRAYRSLDLSPCYTGWTQGSSFYC